MRCRPAGRSCTRASPAGCWCRSRRTTSPTARSCCPTSARSASRFWPAAMPASASTCKASPACCTATASSCAARRTRCASCTRAAGATTPRCAASSTGTPDSDMLKRLALRDFVIVTSLEVELAGGFSVLTGETGAGKSILIDALQLALGSRGDAGVVREGAARADISAEFDTPPDLRAWLDEAGFDNGPDGETLLLRRAIDAQGKSRAWINGSPATVAQLRETADSLLDIHGQHAWQGLTRAPAVRALLDGYAGLDLAPLAAAHAQWKQASE